METCPTYIQVTIEDISFIDPMTSVVDEALVARFADHVESLVTAAYPDADVCVLVSSVTTGAQSVEATDDAVEQDVRDILSAAWDRLAEIAA